MKKIMAVMLAAFLAASVIGCSKEAAPEEREALEVSLVVPAYVVDGMDVRPSLTKEQPGLAVEKDEEKKNYKLELSRSKYDEVLAAYRSAVEEALLEFKTEETFASITDLSYNDDFSEITVKADRNQFEHGTDALSTVAIGLVASTYQYINGSGDNEIRVTIKVVDEADGEAILTAVYPDSFNTKQ